MSDRHSWQDESNEIATMAGTTGRKWIVGGLIVMALAFIASTVMELL